MSLLHHRRLIATFSLLPCMPLLLFAQASDAPPHHLSFAALERHGFSYDTGLLAGQLLAEDRSFGLARLQHRPSGQGVAGRYGLLSVYRVFSDGRRYGNAGWEWPSQPTRQSDGSVRVDCPAAEDRPFALSGTYRWYDSGTVDLTIEVMPEQDLQGFEVFLASYFSAAFTNSAALVANLPQTPVQAGFMRAEQTLGDWLIFPRDSSAVPMIQDGRWRLPPHPVQWTILPELAQPVALRRAPQSGLTVLLMAPRQDCFAVAMPYETEEHYSVYLSLFGRDLSAGQTATARTRMKVLESPADNDLMAAYRDFLE